MLVRLLRVAAAVATVLVLIGLPAPMWGPTTSAHGTHVAGTIAAADDGQGVTGVAPGVRVASVKVVDDEGFIYPEYAACGFMWAAQQQSPRYSPPPGPWLTRTSWRPCCAGRPIRCRAQPLLMTRR